MEWNKPAQQKPCGYEGERRRAESGKRRYKASTKKVGIEFSTIIARFREPGDPEGFWLPPRVFNKLSRFADFGGSIGF